MKLFGILKWSAPLVLLAAIPAAWLEHRSKLARLSDSEFDRVRTNFEAFEKLPAVERERLRQLHLELMDSKQERAELERALLKFTEWRDTLTPQQREKLDRATAIDEKINLIRQLTEEQASLISQSLSKLRSPDPGRPGGHRPPGPPGPPGFDRPGMGPGRRGFLSEAVSNSLNNEERVKLATLDYKERYAYGFCLSLKYGALSREHFFWELYDKMYKNSTYLHVEMGPDPGADGVPERFGALLAMTYLFPPLDHVKLLDGVQEKKPIRDMVAITGMSPLMSLAKPVVTLEHYYKVRKDVPAAYAKPFEELLRGAPAEDPDKKSSKPKDNGRPTKTFPKRPPKSS